MSSDIESTPVDFNCGEVLLRGEQWPAKRGHHVVFLHGGGQTRHSWASSARQVASDGWTTTAIDLRGHGDSDWSPRGRYTIDANADDIRNVVHQLGNQPVLVGASLGGLTALAAQGSDDTLARALVLVDVVPRTAPEGVRRIRDFMTEHLGGFDSLEDVADAVAAYTRRERRRDVAGLRKNVRQRDDGRWYWHWDPRMVPAQRDLDTTPPVPVDDLLEGARKITVPILIVHGGRSDVVTSEGINELLSAAPHATVIEVPGAGHMVAGDDNEAFTKAVQDFLHSISS